ncbi:hypothetical protein RQP46_001128 [Phenoliferia psychrophenolica]
MMLKPFLAVASLAQVALSLSNDQIASVFGAGATGLTGNSVQLTQFMLTVVTNATHALCSLNATTTSPSKVGWMGMGVGSAMMNADFLVTWPNLAAGATPATPFTLSHRNSPGEIMPVVAEAGATLNHFTLLPQLSSLDASSSFTAVSYIRLLAMPSGYVTTSTMKTIARGPQSFIYASSTVKPEGTAEDAVLTQHDQAHGPTMLDLSVPITLAAAGTSSSAPATGVTSSKPPRAKRDMYLIAHAVVGTLGLLLFSPAAILVARLLRGSTWFPAHAALNLLAAVLVIAGFALGYTNNLGPHFHDTHTKCGLALLILVLLQVLLGSVAHRVKASPSPTARFPTLSGKSPVRLVHIVLGIAIIALGFFQIHEGFEEYPLYSTGGESVPMGAYIVYYILIALIAAAYLAGWIKEGLGMNAPAHSGSNVEKVSSQ